MQVASVDSAMSAARMNIHDSQHFRPHMVGVLPHRLDRANRRDSKSTNVAAIAVATSVFQPADGYVVPGIVAARQNRLAAKTVTRTQLPAQLHGRRAWIH
jgi:hypothetical protein